MWINHHLEVRNLKVGYHIGVFGKIPLTDYLALQPGVRPTDILAKPDPRRIRFGQYVRN